MKLPVIRFLSSGGGNGEARSDSRQGQRVTRRVYFCFYGEHAEVPSSAPVQMEDADIASGLFWRLTGDRDFLGITDDARGTLQVMYYSDGDRYWVEVPVPEAGGAYGRYMTFDEVADLLKALPARFEPDAVPGLEFHKWQKENTQ